VNKLQNTGVQLENGNRSTSV